MRSLCNGSIPKMALVLGGLLLAGGLTRSAGQAGQEAKTIAPFVLPDAAGKPWPLAKHKGQKATVVIFLGTQCPISNKYAPSLAELEKQYKVKGVQFVAVNSNLHDTAKDIAEHATKYRIPFPVLRDADQKVADRFGAQRVPAAYVLDAGLKVVYGGRIDDQFGIGFARAEPNRRDLIVALDELLAGKAVSQSSTPVAGCYITRAPQPKAAVTYAKEVSRILQNRCQECHRPGQMGPMPLLTYEDASSWAAMIREVVSDKRMPPWHADPKHGIFANDRSLTRTEYDTLLAWIDQGCPKGNNKDLPAERNFPASWSIGEPDLVVSMDRSYKVPAMAREGARPYEQFNGKTDLKGSVYVFKEDVYVRGIEIKPGAPEVVHHIVLWAMEPGGGFLGQVLATWVRGDRGTLYPEGSARKIAKGTTLRFQIWYTPNGFAQEDKSSVAFVLAKGRVTNVTHSKLLLNQNLAIPPGNRNYRLSKETLFDKEVLVYSLTPHMHLRGKSFDFEAIYPDGKRELLLSVPRYDFAWETKYVLAKPARLPAGTKLECVGVFDNSKDNPNNPDPTVMVFFGLHTWEEMLAAVVEYSYVGETGPRRFGRWRRGI
jgi:thiol-disulfide isomerase/thioredoxin